MTQFQPRPQAGLGPGTVLGNTYRIEALLARGGMGEVYRATHVELGTTHAVKVILPSLADDPIMVQLLLEEARKLARLRHDAIVGYEGLSRDESGLRYLVMEFVEGESLLALLRRRPLEPAEVLQLRDRLAEGLAAAHEKGVIHRDISPENILLPRGEIGRAKLIDFGIAKAADAEHTLIGSEFAGKYSYASPEQVGLFGGRVDLRSDIYSLGLVLATASIGFGRKLDMGTSMSTVLAARQSVPDLSAVPAELRPVIAPMLEPNPDDRPSSMRALLPQMTQLSPIQQQTRAPAPKPVAARGGRSLLLLGGGVAAAVLVAGLLFVLRGTMQPPSVDAVRAELATLTAGYECARISSAVAADRSVQVTGFVATAGDRERLRRAISGAAGIGPVSFDVHEVAWPYCDVVRLLRPYAAGRPGDAPSIALDKAAYNGQRLALAVGMPDFDGYVYVDYFTSGGKVLHLLPNGRDLINIKPARNSFVLGEAPTSAACWTLGDGSGEQLVTVIATSKPLFAGPQPETEGAGNYLDSLSHALAGAGRAHAATLFFELRRPPFTDPSAGCSSS